MNNEVYDPVELVKDLADRIGIHQLYAIAREIRGEGDTAVEPRQVAEMKANIDYLSRQNERLRGEIKALAFAVKCNGVSGNEVRYEVN